MEMDDQCCEAYYPQFLWPWPNTISMNDTSLLFKMNSRATKPPSWPLMRTNKDSRVLYLFFLNLKFFGKCGQNLRHTDLWAFVDRGKLEEEREVEREERGKRADRAMAGWRRSSEVLTSLLIRIYRVQGRGNGKKKTYRLVNERSFL